LRNGEQNMILEGACLVLEKEPFWNSKFYALVTAM